MEKGKNNAVLLTVIGIATLLVAIVGATFAYFSARTTYNYEDDPNSVLKITSSSNGGTIIFEGGDPIPVSNIYPKDGDWVNKTVNVKYSNPTTVYDYSYDLYVVYDNEFDTNQVTYTFAPATGTVCLTNGSLATSDAGCTKSVTTSSTAGDTIIAAVSSTGFKNTTDGQEPLGTQTEFLGTGTFKPTENQVNHVYSFKIQFPNDTTNSQNTQQGKSLNAYIRISEHR